MTPIEQVLAKAASHASRHEWAAARVAYLQAHAHAPDSAAILLELSYVESLDGRYGEARRWALLAAKIKSVDVDQQIALLRRLRTFNLMPELIGIAQAALAATQRDARVLIESAMQASNTNCHRLALDCAQAAVDSEPRNLTARLVLGQMLAQHGDIETASARLRGVLSEQPDIASAWWSLSKLTRHTRHANNVEELRNQSSRMQLRPDERAALGFALHKELDDIGDTVGAWAALEDACAAKRSTLNYSVDDSRQLVAALIAQPTGGAVEIKATLSKTPVFIVGMHRSGTTLLEQLLDVHPQVHGVGELYDFTSAMRYVTDHHCQGVIDLTIVARALNADFSEVGQHYLDGMDWRLGGESHFTDKLPSNFLNIGFICQALPQARILHMVRDPVETCFSNLRELFSTANGYSYDQAELADYFIHYRRLMAHWHTAFPGRILDVDYTRLTSDTAGAMREVATFCGLGYVDAMRDPRNSDRAVATASAVQVREGIVRRERPKWAPYARQLQPLIKALRQGGIEVPELPV
ncbi:MAG: sulfotransferase [Pseudomonadota bacterium]|nr:sulfotransferase [Pseudomonadota bacterium]MDQ3160102.1 sulfotransferase [Pseudomonadota bacterium]